MPHFSTVAKIVIDVSPAAHDQELAFWSAAAGSDLKQFANQPEYHGARLNEHLGLLVQKLEEGESRVHIDIHTDDLDAEVARLESLGAQRVQQIRFWWVMRDPAGLPFCVIRARPDSLNETNSTRWE